MTIPDQTNAEVSDERLRDDELARQVRGIAAVLIKHEFTAIRSPARTAAILNAAADALTRRSVTSQASEGEPENLHIIFDGPPSHESGRFVEVENDAGASVRAGEWVERPDGLWDLVIPRASPSKRVERLEAALIADLETLLNDIDDQGYMLKREWTPELRERVWAFADRFQALGDRS